MLKLSSVPCAEKACRGQSYVSVPSVLETSFPCTALTISTSLERLRILLCEDRIGKDKAFTIVRYLRSSSAAHSLKCHIANILLHSANGLTERMVKHLFHVS